MEDGSPDNSGQHTKMFESLWHMEVINFFESQMSHFTIRDLFFDVDLINKFSGVEHNVFQC